jgi:hypothetical protein
MTSTSNVSEVDRFRAAWLSVEGDDAMARAERISLEVSAAGRPDLMQAVAALKAPSQAELDLHLAGEGVIGHETEAGPFGKLVTRTATAVKELGKSISGKKRLALSLMVLAPAEGSVRVIFRAPVPKTAEGVIPGVATPSTLDTLALKRLAAILSHSDDLNEDSPLYADVQALRGGARSAVRLVAKAVIDGGWDVDGRFRQQGQPEERVLLTQGGARRLVAATNEATRAIETLTTFGVVDGQRRSLGAMWFVPADGRAIEAAVSDPDLLRRVAEIAAEPSRSVRAKFNVFVTYPAGDAGGARRSYELADIEEAPEQRQLSTSSTRQLTETAITLRDEGRLRPPLALEAAPESDKKKH